MENTLKLKSKFKSLEEWKFAEPEAYAAAIDRGIIQKICDVHGWKQIEQLIFTNPFAQFIANTITKEFDTFMDGIYYLDYEPCLTNEELDAEVRNIIAGLGVMIEKYPQI